MQLILRILTVLTLLCATAAQAQDDLDGTWHVATDSGAPLMTLTLDQTGSAITGFGSAEAGMGAYANGVATVIAGAALGANLELELEVEAATAGLPAAIVRVVVFDAVGTTVFFEGRIITATFAPAGDTPAETPADILPQIVPTGAICEDLAQLEQSMFLQADNRMRLELGRVYDAADAQFGVETTEPRCVYLFEQLTVLQSGGLATTTPGTATTPADPQGLGQRPLGAPVVCDGVAPLVAQIRLQEAAAGLTDDGSVADILETSGLGVDGIWSTGACEFGMSNLQDYFDQISVAQLGQPVTPGATVKDPVGTGPVSGGDIFDMTFQVRDVSDGLNVRAGPSTGSIVIGVLPYFARDVRMVGEGCSPAITQPDFASLTFGAQLSQLEGRWCMVRWNGVEGWVSGRYLRPQ